MQQASLQQLKQLHLQIIKQQTVQKSSQLSNQEDLKKNQIQETLQKPLQASIQIAQIPLQITPIISSQKITQQNLQLQLQAPTPPKPKSKLKALFKSKPCYFLQPKVLKTQSIQKIVNKQTQLKNIEQNLQNKNQQKIIIQNASQYKQQMMIKTKKIQLQQTSQDSKSQQSKKNKISLQKSIIKKLQPQISLQTQKILAILDQKQSFLKSQTKQNNPTKKQLQKQSQISSIQKSNEFQYQQNDKNNPKKCKHAGKHFKIFNPQHFQIYQNQQVKTSIKKWEFGTGQTPSQLLISSWNVNGIRARMICNDIYPYLESTKPDIFCINQHKMDQKSFEQSPIKFWGYHSYWNFPKYSLGYSGVAIFSKYRAKQMVEDIHIPQHSKEGRVITLQFDKFIIIQAYIPTVGRQLQRLRYRVEQYDPAFRQYINNLYSKYPNKTIIVCGDLNVSHKNIDCHVGKRMKQGIQPAFTFQERNSFSTLLKQVKLIDTFRHFYPNQRKYTWWNMRRGGRTRGGQTGIGKRLDYFLVDNQSLKYVKSSIIQSQVQGCDHCPIQLKIDFSSKQINQSFS